MEIKKFTPADHFVRCTIYGWSWVGKTVFGWTAPKAIFASSENWLLSIVSTLWYSPDYANIKSIKGLQELYKHLKGKWKWEYKTLVIDSLTEINEIIKEWIEQRTGKQMSRNEWWELSRKIKDIIRSFKDLEMHVIVICQEKNSTNDEWVIETIYPMLNGKNSTEIAYMMDIVGYMYIDKDWERHITTAPNQKLLSKDRSWQIGRDAPLDFKEWTKRIAWITKQKTWVTTHTMKILPWTHSSALENPFTGDDLAMLESSLIAGDVFFTTPQQAVKSLEEKWYTLTSSMKANVSAVMLTSLRKIEKKKEQKNASDKDVSQKWTTKTIAK